jgi:hypothetical protein
LKGKLSDEQHFSKLASKVKSPSTVAHNTNISCLSSSPCHDHQLSIPEVLNSPYFDSNVRI